MLGSHCQLHSPVLPVAPRSLASHHLHCNRPVHSQAAPLPARSAPCQARTQQTERTTRCHAAATEEAPAEEALSQRLQIKLKSFDIGLLDLSVEEIMQVANNTGANPGKGPAYLPTKRRRWCVLRSPHVNKTSREHFETRTHQRIVQINSLTADTIDALMGLDLPAGVDVEVKL
ncbi:hypothetical protein WJX74_002271 [Apatococcus lobatus]|uniref:Small ribosomal subunit protein uS10 domain-containing protein n=1 Tax=Apatococcus lobatus TaxID=904363 RepID=A0AAW1RKE5_9CHLO